jgi:hypothetical protein
MTHDPNEEVHGRVEVQHVASGWVVTRRKRDSASVENHVSAIYDTREDAEEAADFLRYGAGTEVWLLGRSERSVGTRMFTDRRGADPLWQLQLQEAIDVAHDSLRAAFDLMAAGTTEDKMIALEIMAGLPRRMRDTAIPQVNRAREILEQVVPEQSDWLVGYVAQHAHGVVVRGLDPRREDQMRRLSEW